MTTITLPRAVVEQALEVINDTAYGAPVFRQEVRDTITALRAALAQQAEPTVTEDMKSAVRWAPSSAYWSQRLREFFGPDAREGIDALERRLAKAQQAEQDLSRCPQCNGPADNGFDRSFPPSPYLCTKCMAKPAQDPTVWVASKDGRVIYDDASTDDGLLQVSGDFENDEQRSRYAQRIVDKLNAALAQQAEPTLTIERLRYALVASRIIPPAAVEDPDEYDDGVTLHRIEALHRRIA